MKVETGVIAAAGSGTRMLPVTLGYPKELLPIINKPAIQLIVEEFIEAGLKKIVIVTGENPDPLHRQYKHPAPPPRGKHKPLDEFLDKLSGVEILFEPGETLCAIDVNSGTAGGRQGRGPRRPVEVNLEAVPAIAGQLRLRNLGGALVIDFITMRSAYDRDKVQAALAEALADDPVPTQLYGFTRLGHFELTRARRGATLSRRLESLERGDAH